MSTTDRANHWTVKLYEDGSLVVYHNDHAMRLANSAVMDLVDAFSVLFGLAKRGV